MRNFILLQKLVLCLYLLFGHSLSAQQVIIESIQALPENPANFRYGFDKQNYTKILDENNQKIYISNNEGIENKTVSNSEKNTENVTLTVELLFDLGQFTATPVLSVYDETGYAGFILLMGGSFSTSLPPGTYDIVANFRNTSTLFHHIVIKEMVVVEEDTHIQIDVAEAANHISMRMYDESGELLEPGIEDPNTGIVTGGNAWMLALRYLHFSPTNRASIYSFSWGVKAYEEQESLWDFYINDLSDRYSIIQNIVGFGYDGLYPNDHYFSKYETLSGISESIALENNPADYVFHQEKFQQSPVGNTGEPTFLGFGTMTTYEGNDLQGWNVHNHLMDSGEGFNVYLNNPLDGDPSDLLVFPSIVDHTEVIINDWGEEQEVDFFIRGNAIIKGDNEEVLYGSGYVYHNLFFLGQDFYLTESLDYKVLPFHDRFSFSGTENPGILYGDNTPISVIAIYPNNTIKSQYKGRYGEVREGDFFDTHVEVKQDDDVIFSGNYMDFLQFSLPVTGQMDITFTNTNIEVDGLNGKNVTQITYNASQEDMPPTLQMLQFRDADGKVTDRFDNSENGVVRLSAGDFQYTPVDFGGYFAYNEGNTVELYYSLYGQDDWTELELTEYPEHFFMPAFGDYYEASLGPIQTTGNDVWYDVQIVCTDAIGNQQIQTVSPAFQLNSTLGINEVITQSNLVIYPNPFSGELQIQLPENIKGGFTFSVTDITGRTVYSESRNADSGNFTWDGSSLSNGIYICSIISEGQIIAKKVIKR